MADIEGYNLPDELYYTEDHAWVKVEGDEKKRGWGIFLIENLVDGFSVETNPDGGNVVTMLICLDKQGPA
jgi:anti-sigma regulatory factor (Ser/Thr protein kinase)